MRHGLVMLLLASCGGAPLDPQLPPVGNDADVVRWLSAAHYKSWACEPAPHDARPPGAHGRNRICSNAKLAAHGAGDYPVGAATVKEIFDSSDKVTGHALAVKIKAGSAADTWHWYERLGSGTVANAPAAPACVGCHSTAGSDAMRPGHDYIFTQVK